MRLLLDTQVYLWFLADASQLSQHGRRAIGEADVVYVSAATIWEAAIKMSLGKLKGNMAGLVDGIVASGFTELSITARHAKTVLDLTFHHRDPFDRLLVAQAITEPLHLLTADPALLAYSSLVTLMQPDGR